MFIQLSGFLFLLIIIILIIATSKFNYQIFSELDVDAQLESINESPERFRTGTMLLIFEHLVIISLAVSLFLAFGEYNYLLGIVWVIARSLEGLIQINNKRTYLGLLDIAHQYTETSGDEKQALGNSTLAILKLKNSVFSIAQILFSIGTLAYSILFVVYGVIPAAIGWLGIASSIIYGFGNGIARVRPDSKALWNLGGLLIWIFELVTGGWLLFSFLLP